MSAAAPPAGAPAQRHPQVAVAHTVEIVSDSGEGAQRCGQLLARIAAKSGRSVWTTEIIPAEIKPPARSVAGASGNRVRIGSFPVTNGGDAADLAVAFNEAVLEGRRRAGALAPGSTILVDASWATHADPDVAASYRDTTRAWLDAGHPVVELPVPTDRRGPGANMWILGVLCCVYGFDLTVARAEVARGFAKKHASVVAANAERVAAGHAWAAEHLDLAVDVPPADLHGPHVVLNGNDAIALGVVAAGIEVVAMYPITPATSASHRLAEILERAGGVVHQAEDEIAAACMAIGASYAGRCAATITSGPGLSLKQEALGLASMAEIPLVVVDVQRGGPSTGQPTKPEQGDLLASLFGTHGDAPKVVLAAADVADCFDAVVEARMLAETYRMPVIVLSDAVLATAQQVVPRPELRPDAFAAAPDPRPVPDGWQPYDWDEATGLSLRAVPGQPGGAHTVTGLAHDRASRVAYDPAINAEGLRHRSRKLAALSKVLRPPEASGDPEGDLLVVGWGSTRGTIAEAAGRVRARGRRVGVLHLRYLQPLAPGVGEILHRYDRVLCVEMAYSDRPDDPLVDDDNRRHGPLATLLRSRYLVDAESWGQVTGQPIAPSAVEAAIVEHLS